MLVYSYVQFFALSDDTCNGNTCSGHGTCTSGSCTCERMYSGSVCQYKGDMLISYSM